MKTTGNDPSANKDLGFLLKSRNQTDGSPNFKRTLGLLGGVRGDYGVRRNITEHDGTYRPAHDRILHTLRLNETSRYYATRPEGSADKEKPRRLQHRGLFGKDACNVFCIPARPAYNPRGEAFETASMALPLKVKLGRTVSLLSTHYNTIHLYSCRGSDGLPPIDLFTGAGGVTERSPRFFHSLEKSIMAQTAADNINGPNLPVHGARATAAQLCAKYQVSRTTWWRWSKTPGFPEPLRFGRSVRWDPGLVDTFLTHNSQATA